jgi:predicted DNA repair protein MutK
MMKGLSVAGTAAMFLVGGGILAHGIPGLHEWIDAFTHGAQPSLRLGSVGAALVPLAIDAVVGIVAGAIATLVVSLVRRARGATKAG